MTTNKYTHNFFFFFFFLPFSSSSSSSSPPLLPEPVPFPPHLSPEAKHFLELCFIRDPTVRAKVEDLLRHPFLNDEKV